MTTSAPGVPVEYKVCAEGPLTVRALLVNPADDPAFTAMRTGTTVTFTLDGVNTVATADATIDAIGIIRGVAVPFAQPVKTGGLGVGPVSLAYPLRISPDHPLTAVVVKLVVTYPGRTGPAACVTHKTRITH